MRNLKTPWEGGKGAPAALLFLFGAFPTEFVPVHGTAEVCYPQACTQQQHSKQREQAEGSIFGNPYRGQVPKAGSTVSTGTAPSAAARPSDAGHHGAGTPTAGREASYASFCISRQSNPSLAEPLC